MKSIRLIVRAIRKSARARLRLSRSSWREYKRSRGPFYRRSFPGGRRLGQIYVLAIVVFAAQHRDPRFALFVLALYSTATVLQRAHAFQQSLYHSFDLAFFMHCPVADRKFFSHAWRSMLKSSFSIWLSAFGVFALLVVRSEMSPRFWFLAVIASALHWLFLLSLILIADRFVPTRQLMRISLPLYILTFASFFAPDFFVRATWTPVSFLPTAWIPSLLERAAFANESPRIFLIIPALGIIALLPPLYRSARSRYPRWELQYPIALFVANEEDDSDVSASGPQYEVDALKQPLRLFSEPQTVSLARLDWNSSSWLEKIAGKSLNAAEKATAGFLLGGQLGSWSRGWSLGVRVAAAGLAVLLFPVIPMFVGILIGLVGTGFAVPLFGGSWLGLQLVPTYGTVRLACAGLPVSYTLASRAIAKINSIRLITWLPAFLLYGAAIAWREAMPFQFGLWMAIRVFFALFSLQPILILGKHSQGTNDSRQVNFHSVIFLLAALFLGTIYVGCSIAFVVVPSASTEPHPILLTTFAVAMISSSFLLWSTYRIFYDRGRLDTIRVGDR